MDTKIQKYANRCEIAARCLMALALGQWPFKWLLDWYVFYSMVWIEHINLTKSSVLAASDVTKSSSLATYIEKLTANQLWQVNFFDRLMQVDMGEWIGLANLAKLSWASRLLCFLTEGVAVGIMVLGFYFFIKMMKQLKKGSVFSSEVIKLLNKITKVIFWFAVYVPINRAITSLIIFFESPAGHRFWFPMIGFSDLLTFRCKLVFRHSYITYARELRIAIRTRFDGVNIWV